MPAPSPPPFRSAAAALLLSLLAPAALAASHKPADYPLRVHIYKLTRHTQRWHGVVEWVDGDGRANLFEDGSPRGIDFTYDCGDRFMNSSGYETYFARWKKPGRSLVLLLREIGSNSTDTCELKVDLKDFAYVRRRGVLDTEPVSVFKDWMTQHQYDPEHGRDEPLNMRNSATRRSASPSVPQPSTQPAQQQPPSSPAARLSRTSNILAKTASYNQRS